MKFDAAVQSVSECREHAFYVKREAVCQVGCSTSLDVYHVYCVSERPHLKQSAGVGLNTKMLPL